MSTATRRIDVIGEAPFKQSGVYEVEISICDSPPSAEAIGTKKFPSLWHDRFHLHVKDSKFTQTLGSSANPIPDSVFQLSAIWIIVSDQFSSLHTIFQFKLSAADSFAPSTKAQTAQFTENKIGRAHV